jgi:hypothetical protein
MSNTSSTDGILHGLKIQAQIDLNTSNDYPIRAWITSAKKCFDQVVNPGACFPTLPPQFQRCLYYRLRKM